VRYKKFPLSGIDLEQDRRISVPVRPSGGVDTETVADRPGSLIEKRVLMMVSVTSRIVKMLGDARWTSAALCAITAAPEATTAMMNATNGNGSSRVTR
jgi:hypothetical protein